MRLTPKTTNGYYKNKFFQRLTEDVGHPKLRGHMAGVVMLMKCGPNWQVFMDRLDMGYPQCGSTLLLSFPENYPPPDTAHTPRQYRSN
jgi:hypothetical protein